MELTALAGNAQIKAQLAHREGDLAHAYIVAGPAAAVPIAEKPPGASIPTSP